MLQTTLLHSGWEFCGKTWPDHRIGDIHAPWLPAVVPGHVHCDLQRAGVIPDPFARMSEIGCQWVDEKDWVYRLTFHWAPMPGLPRRVLRFEGLDTVCAVFLNGEEVARHDNMFVPLEVDVTDRLREGPNDLRVEFDSAVRVGEQRRKAYFATEGLPHDVGAFDERTFVRKVQCMSGWDWGPRLVSCGIWRPVKIVEYASRILDVHVAQHLDGDAFVLDVHSETDGDGVVAHTVVDQDGKTVAESGGDAPLRIEGPQLWEPHAPRLYRLTTRLCSGSNQEELLDERAQSIGLREIVLRREPDRFGESFEFVVNGKPFWARGANWIPDHSFPSLVTGERYRQQLRRAADIGCNMLRVWGGGLYETDEFYDVCDELGILVWQDFPFSCRHYREDDGFQVEIAREADVNIKRLRNHASLAIWCGNNENQWLLSGSKGRLYGLPIYTELLPALLQRLDPGRPYIESSPIGTDEDPGCGDRGDCHYWDVWHGRGDWVHYADAPTRFTSEFGFASSCGLHIWERVLAGGDWSPTSAAARWHDKTGKTWEQFAGYVRLHYPEPETLKDWVYYSQLNQRDAMRFGIECFRRSEYCRGALIWQLNDCYPAQSWSLIDCDGTLKPAAYELRRLFADALLSIFISGDRVELWGINDGIAPVVGTARLRFLDIRTGEIAHSVQAEVGVAPDERKSLLEASLEGYRRSALLIAADLGRVLARQLAAEPKDAVFAAPCELTVWRAGGGTLRFETPEPLVDLYLTSNFAAENPRDNLLTIPEPGTFEVRFAGDPNELTARSLAGYHGFQSVS